MTDTEAFFASKPETLPLYEAIRAAICSAFEEVTVTVQKTQISFSNRYNFAFVSLPARRVKGAPAVYILFTFGLGYQLAHPRIAVSTEPYPNRWTHHVIIQDEDEIDDQLMEWVKEAYNFSMYKGRGK